MNKLECPLCQEPFQQPSMCPHCSEVYCINCIKNYLSLHYFCPSCDQHIIELVDCSRLINEVKEKILQNGVKKSKENSFSSNELCKQHNLPLKYQCTTCETQICSDCGLISQKHKGHVIKPKQNTRKNQNIILSSQLKEIKDKIEQQLFYLQDEQKRFKLELELVKSQIKYNKSKIYEYYEELILKLEKQTDAMLIEIKNKIQRCDQLIKQKQIAKSKIDFIFFKSFKHVQFSSQSAIQISKTLTLESQTLNTRSIFPSLYNDPNNLVIEISDLQLYNYLKERNYIQSASKNNNEKSMISSRNFLKKQQEKCSTPKQQSKQSHEFSVSALSFDKTIYQLGIMNQIYPEYHNFSFQLDYELLKHYETVYSPNFKIFGYEWRLKIYPKGNAQAFGEHLSLFLQLINSPEALTTNTSKQYFFRLELLNLNQAGKSVIKQYNSKFSVGQCWGYAQFTPIRELKDYLHEGKLLFVMGVKNISYFDLCENMKKYISKLQSQSKILSELCENYYLQNQNSSLSQNNQSSPILNLSGHTFQASESIIANNFENMHIVNEEEISSIISSADEIDS